MSHTSRGSREHIDVPRGLREGLYRELPKSARFVEMEKKLYEVDRRANNEKVCEKANKGATVESNIGLSSAIITVTKKE